MIPDVQKLMEMEAAVPCRSKYSSPLHTMTWDSYHSLEDMYSYLDYLENKYDYIRTEVIGKSYEGRDMRVLKVCRVACGYRPAVWVDGGIHAREFISPAVVTWMIREIVENDADHPDMTERVDWHILVCHNPDGYAFARKEDRNWRKTS